MVYPSLARSATQSVKATKPGATKGKTGPGCIKPASPDSFTVLRPDKGTGRGLAGITMGSGQGIGRGYGRASEIWATEWGADADTGRNRGFRRRPWRRRVEKAPYSMAGFSRSTTTSSKPWRYLFPPRGEGGVRALKGEGEMEPIAGAFYSQTEYSKQEKIDRTVCI